MKYNVYAKIGSKKELAKWNLFWEDKYDYWKMTNLIAESEKQHIHRIFIVIK